MMMPALGRMPRAGSPPTLGICSKHSSPNTYTPPKMTVTIRNALLSFYPQ